MTLLAWLSLGCERKRPDAKPEATARLATVERFQCTRCHAVEGLSAPDPLLDCTGCHQSIFTDHFANYPEEEVERWRANVRHFRLTPSLRGVDRFRRDWFEQFLLAPHDVRPGLTEQMPRLDVTPEDARRLADELGLRSSDEGSVSEPLAGDAERGRVLYVEYGCAECHRFSGADAPPGPAFDGPAPGTQRRAPDLRHARRRMTRSALDRWLANPSKVKVDTLMTQAVPDPDHREHLVAYLLETPLESAPRPSPVPLPEPLERDVRWEEVNRAIFHATCRHCHSSGGPALPGDGGIGNTGGFGYDGAGLVLSSYEGVRRGSLGTDGARRDILTPDETGVSPIVRHLMARHEEMRGEPAKGVLGMPLGLPPVALEDIALLRGWIAQGARR